MSKRNFSRLSSDQYQKTKVLKSVERILEEKGLIRDRIDYGRYERYVYVFLPDMNTRSSKRLQIKISVSVYDIEFSHEQAWVFDYFIEVPIYKGSSSISGEELYEDGMLDGEFEKVLEEFITKTQRSISDVLEDDKLEFREEDFRLSDPRGVR
jgi:hypothetical protein